jgi:hypothetical protein
MEWGCCVHGMPSGSDPVPDRPALLVGSEDEDHR